MHAWSMFGGGGLHECTVHACALMHGRVRAMVPDRALTVTPVTAPAACACTARRQMLFPGPGQPCFQPEKCVSVQV